jgi:hypothetical protein
MTEGLGTILLFHLHSNFFNQGMKNKVDITLTELWQLTSQELPESCPNLVTQEAVLPQLGGSTATIMPHRGSTIPQSCPNLAKQEAVLPHRRQYMLKSCLRQRQSAPIMPQSCHTAIEGQWVQRPLVDCKNQPSANFGCLQLCGSYLLPPVNERPTMYQVVHSCIFPGSMVTVTIGLIKMQGSGYRDHWWTAEQD